MKSFIEIVTDARGCGASLSERELAARDQLSRLMFFIISSKLAGSNASVLA